MEREQPPYRAALTKPARSSIWPTLIISAVLMAVIGSGVYLLGQTRAKWEQKRADKATKIAEFERQWQAQQFPPQNDLQRRREASLELEWERRHRAEEALYNQTARDLTEGKLRCINGQTFRKIPNGWENLPDTPCSISRGSR